MRAIQRLIENPLAEALLAGDFIATKEPRTRFMLATMSGSERRFDKATTMVDAA